MSRTVLAILLALPLGLACGAVEEAIDDNGTITMSGTSSAGTGDGPTGDEDSTGSPETTDATADETGAEESTGEPPVEGCEPGSREGPAGSTNDVPTGHGARINVRTPDGYDPTVPHPLIMVYAPAGGDASITEQFTGLTPPALAAGYVIAYADHISPGPGEGPILGAATIFKEVATHWCIDEERIFLTGHSNGGTIAEVAVAVDEEPPIARATAPSAAGVQGFTLEGVGCPAVPRSMMILHSANDGLFPVSQGFGADCAEFWAECNGCTGQPIDAGPCVQWEDCDDDLTVVYCETTGAHGYWPPLNSVMIDFFDYVGG